MYTSHIWVPSEPLLLALHDCTQHVDSREERPGTLRASVTSFIRLGGSQWKKNPDAELLPQASSCCTWTKTTASKWTWTSSSRVSRCPQLVLLGSRGWGLEPEPSPVILGSPGWGCAVPQAPAPLSGNGARMSPAPAGTGDRGWRVKAQPRTKLLARGCRSRSRLQTGQRGEGVPGSRGCSPRAPTPRHGPGAGRGHPPWAPPAARVAFAAA